MFNWLFCCIEEDDDEEDKDDEEEPSLSLERFGVGC